MKSMFDSQTREQTLRRINNLGPASRPLWGKMNVYQMVKHCVLAERHYHGELIVKAPPGTDISSGPKVLKMFLAVEQPMIRNARTAPVFEVLDTDGDLDAEMDNWKALIRSYEWFRASIYAHWYFGEMSREELGQLSFRHSDHHLRQFGV